MHETPNGDHRLYPRLGSRQSGNEPAFASLSDRSVAAANHQDNDENLSLQTPIHSQLTSSLRSSLPPQSLLPDPPSLPVMKNWDGSTMLDHQGRIVYRSQYLQTRPLKSDCKERVGYGGRKFTYVSGDSIIRTMNEVYGHGGWSTEITRERMVQCEMDEKGRWVVGYIATVRVTLNCHEDGSYGRMKVVSHEDCGSGEGINPSKIQAHEKAFKCAVTDAMKRSVRHFGERLGNALYVKTNNIRNAPKSNREALEEVLRECDIKYFGDQVKLRELHCVEGVVGGDHAGQKRRRRACQEDDNEHNVDRNRKNERRRWGEDRSRGDCPGGHTIASSYSCGGNGAPHPRGKDLIYRARTERIKHPTPPPKQHVQQRQQRSPRRCNTVVPPFAGEAIETPIYTRQNNDGAHQNQYVGMLREQPRQIPPQSEGEVRQGGGSVAAIVATPTAQPRSSLNDEHFPRESSSHPMRSDHAVDRTMARKTKDRSCNQPRTHVEEGHGNGHGGRPYHHHSAPSQPNDGEGSKAGALNVTPSPPPTFWAAATSLSSSSSKVLTTNKGPAAARNPYNR